MTFFDRINPKRIPASISPEDTIQVLREKVLQSTLLFASLTGFIVIIFTTIRGFQLNQLVSAVINIGFYLIILFITYFRDLPLRLRALLFVTEVFTIGVMGLLQSGISGDGRVILFTFVIFSGILFGRSQPNKSAGINFRVWGYIFMLATLGIIGVLMSSEIIDTPMIDSVNPHESFFEWVKGNLVFLLSAGLSISSIVILFQDLESSLTQQRSNFQQLCQQSEIFENNINEANAQISNQERNFEIAALIASEITNAANLKELLNGFINIVHKEFGFYHIGIFLKDENNEYAVLKAATGEAGKTMLGNNHRLKIGEIGIVGYSVSHGELRIALNVDYDHFHFKNPLLPLTQSEMALPLRVRGNTIGALDIQSTEPNAFSHQDVRILQLIADQLAAAIDKTQVVESLQNSVTTLQTAYSQISGNAWKKQIQNQTGLFAYRFKNQQVENVLVQLPEAEKALKTGEKVISAHLIDDVTQTPFTNIALPIKIQDQVLGVLNIRVNRETVPTDLLTLFDNSLDRLSLALENARLLEEVQSRADQEHIVSQITTKLRSSIDVDSILETAASELGKTMGVSEVVIQLLENAS
jgi:GAF domain-containing protein